MARPLRLDLLRRFYHVLNRGVERRFILKDDADHRKFIELLGLMSERHEVGIWSYVLSRRREAAGASVYGRTSGTPHRMP